MNHKSFLPTILLLAAASGLRAQTPPSPPVGASTKLQKAAASAFRGQNWAVAAKLYQRITHRTPKRGEAWYRLGYARHALGEYAAALPAHLKAVEFPAVAAKAGYNAACAYALLGQKEKGLQWLTKAIDAGFQSASTMRTDTDLTSLRSDPRFQALLKKLGAPAPRPYNAELHRPRPSSKEQIAKPQRAAFEFMAGNWKIRNTFRSPAGSRQTDATSRGTVQLGGKVLIDHFDGLDWTDKRLRGMTIRAYDAKTDAWKLVWLDDRQAPRFTPMIGKFRDGIGVFYPEGKTAETATTRFHWDGIHSDRARWMQQNKTQTAAGTRWVATWIMEFSRHPKP